MAYTPENNPYIPGDPYSYDLKWMVKDIKHMEERFSELDDQVQEATDQADRSEREADRSRDEADRSDAEALKSEGFAVGEQDGAAVDPDSPYYENNAKFYAEKAQLDGHAEALKAEGFATGEQDETPVDPDSPYYENNSKYFAQEAAASEQAAADYAAHIADPVSGLVTQWLENNVDPDSGYVIDKSLTIPDAAADAQVTGNKIEYDRNGVFPSISWVSGSRAETTPNVIGPATSRATMNAVPYLHEGDMVIISNMLLNTQYTISLSDGSSSLYNSGWIFDGQIFFMPTDAFLLVNIRYSDNSVIDPSDITTVIEIKDKSSRIFELESDRIIPEKLSDTSDFVDISQYNSWYHGFSYSAGYSRFTNVAARTCSDFIPVKPMSDLRGKRVFNIQSFDADKTFIQEDLTLQTNTLNNTTLPDNAAFIIVTYLNQYESDFVLNFRTLVKDTAKTDLLVKHNITNPGSSIINSGQLIPYVSVGSTDINITDDDNRTRYLKKSKKLVITKGASYSVANIRLQYGTDLTDGIGFWFYADHQLIENITYIRAYFHDGSRPTSAVWKAFYPVNGWNFFRASLDECDVVGTPPSMFKYIDFLIEPSGTEGDLIGSCWLDAVFEGYKIVPTIAIGYDGMWTSSNDNGVYDWHINNNIPCNIGFTDFQSNDSTSFNNNYSVLHPIALKMANKYGFEMGAYGGYGDNAGEVRRATDVETCRQLIYGNVNALNNEIDDPIHFYVLSQGVRSNVIEKAALLSGIKVMRATWSQPMTGFCKDANTILSYPIYEAADAAAVKAAIDNIIAHGYCGMFFTHAVVTSDPTPYQTLYSDWIDIMTYILAKVNAGELRVVNVSEMVDQAREEF